MGNIDHVHVLVLKDTLIVFCIFLPKKKIQKKKQDEVFRWPEEND